MLSSTKPYLIRALFDWCVDNGLTPHIVVSVDERAKVPLAYVRDGQIVLNIAPYATHQMSITNEEITCQARFGGVAQSLVVPITNVVAIYARENGQGMAFEVGDRSGAAVELGGVGDGEGVTSAESGEEFDQNDEGVLKPSNTQLSAVEETGSSLPAASDDDDAPDDTPDPSQRRSHLRVIK